MSVNNSGGPKARIAQLAIGAVAIIITRAEKAPPRAEQVTAAPIALPARPCCVIG